MVFLGYGGNDQSINAFLKQCPLPGLAPPIFWVGTDDPTGDMADWLDEREAIHVEHRDFDTAMHMLRGSLKIDHPAEDRWTRARDRYAEALKTYKVEEKTEGDDATRKALNRASASSASSLPGAWGYTIRALEAHNDPDQAEKIYLSGIEEFPEDASLLGAYAVFLVKVRENKDIARSYFERSIKSDPTSADNVGNYALFLSENGGDVDDANKYYKIAIENDQNHVNNLGNYATFLSVYRNDRDGAEHYYKRAVDCGAKSPNHLGNYAQILLARGDEVGLNLLDRAYVGLPAASEAIRIPLGVELAFYTYAHDERAPIEGRLSALKQQVLNGGRSLGWDFSDNIEQAAQRDHPQIDLLAALATVISEDAPVEALEAWPEWAAA